MFRQTREGTISAWQGNGVSCKLVTMVIGDVETTRGARLAGLHAAVDCSSVVGAETNHGSNWPPYCGVRRCETQINKAPHRTFKRHIAQLVWWLGPACATDLNSGQDY